MLNALPNLASTYETESEYMDIEVWSCRWMVNIIEFFFEGVIWIIEQKIENSGKK